MQGLFVSVSLRHLRHFCSGGVAVYRVAIFSGVVVFLVLYLSEVIAVLAGEYFSW